MTKIEKAQAALKAVGVNTTATKWETLMQKLSEKGLNPDSFTDDALISNELIKTIKEKGGLSFDSEELQQQLKEEKENEYPDYGGEIPEGEYTVTGFSTIHDWKNKKTGNVSHIRTAFISSDSNAIYELPFAAMCKNQWEFVKFEGRDSEGKLIHSKVKMNQILPYYTSIADRNIAITNKIAAGTRIKVLHAMGHYNNPYRVGKIFNFLTTWAELA